MSTPYLSNEQVQQLNEKHGWFEFRDAQSEVSRAFAQDAIAMHEAMRAAAPDLLAALKEAVRLEIKGCDLLERCESAIAKAEGKS